MAEGDIKLYYFGSARGRAECIRMLLTAAAVPFEDVRVDHRDWFGDSSTLKKEAPFGQMPFVIYKGKKIAQSIPIASFFAKKYGFYPTTDEEVLREEEVLHLATDFRFPHIRDWFWTKDQERIDTENRFKTQHFPRYLGYFEALLKENGGSGFFVGEKMTLADIVVADLMTTVLGIDPEALTSFPLVQKMCHNVNTLPALQDYLAKRPHMVR